MATTLDDNGIIFPDATTQTTAVDLSSGIDVTGTVTANDVTIQKDNPTLLISDTGTANQETEIRQISGTLYIRPQSGASVDGSVLIDGGYSGQKKMLVSYNGDVSFYEDTGATAKFYWDASAERLGIGTTSPAQLLEVSGNGGKSRFTRSGSAGTTMEFYYGGSSAGGIQVNSTGLGISGGTGENHLLIDTSGNVGIGTTSPTQKLDVNGTIKATAFSGPGVATVSSSNPATNTNGSVGDIYANSTTGQMFVCTDATSNNNVWRNVGNGTTDIEPINYPTATGGTVTTSGNYKIHTFTSSGTFTVSDLGNQGTTFDFLVVAGGGGGGGSFGGGGGAGGYRTSAGTSGANTSAESSKTLSATSYTITVGAGGGGGSNGGNSSALGVTSTGGGRGGAKDNYNANSGGSGGGADYSTSAGSGTSGQGKNGGGAGLANGNSVNAGGGGGASANGGSGGSSGAGNGGNGLASSITGSSVTRAGGGAGNYEGYNGAAGPGTGGSGGGGNSRATGTANTGGGGGGNSKAGGSGIVVIRYQYQ